MTTFTFYADPSHGWLKVATWQLADVGLDLEAISAFSYMKGCAVYLEEDCDAPKFIRAYQATYGREPKIEEQHTNARSFIRGLPSIRSFA